MPVSAQSTSRPATLRMVEQIEHLAESTGDRRLRQALRAAACDLLDAALRQHRPPQPAIDMPRMA